MLRINVANEIGFCFGVDRAIKIVETLIRRGAKVYVTGDLIHNEDEMKRLKMLGLESLDLDRDWPDLSEVTVVVRAHGLPLKTLERLKNKAHTVVNATCPVVFALANSLKNAEANGFELFLYGHEGHDEVEYLKSVVKKLKVIKSYDDVEISSGKVALFSQTTMDTGRFSDIAVHFSHDVQHLSTLLVQNSICHITFEREEEVKRLARDNDVCIVVGGKKSSNTKKLFEMAKSINLNSYLILDSTEIEMKWVESAQSVGICSGTSTPQRIISEIVEKLRTFKI